MKKEYFTIPNLMGYFRILLIPVFCVLYYHSENAGCFYGAVIVLCLSFLSDFFDGKIARHFHQVTEWGKMLDPIADKLTQAALAIMCTVHFPATIWLFLLFAAKEIYMGLMGLLVIRKKNQVFGAKRFGKIGTAGLDFGILALILFPGMPLLVSNLLILVLMILMVVTWILYLRFHIELLTDKTFGKIKKRYKAVGVAGVFLYLILGAALPYLNQPKVSEEYKKEFANKVFASENSAGDRVMLIEDNGEALAERIRMLEHAKQSIVLSTFDFHSDISGKKMLAALWAAAERGVKVKILADGCNSWLRMTGNAYFYALASHENVTIKTYNPVNPLLPFRAMSRMHDKYVIVDDSLYLLGGRNVYDSFLGAQDGPKNYDRDVLVYHEGEKEGSLYQVKAYFEAIWNDSLCKTWNDNHLLRLIPGVKRAEQELEKQYISLKKQEPGWFQTISYQEKTVAANRITLLSNPTCLYSKEPQVFYGLCELMKQAKKEVIWHTPYIINNDYMYGEIAKIAKEVPEFTIMTNSVKNNGNPFGSVDYALHKDEVLKMGAKVLEYHGGVSYHGKSAVIDDRLAIVGSFNMDMKSAYQDTELMLVIDSRPLCEILKKSFTSYQKEADAADGTQDSKEELFDDTTSELNKVSNYVISKLNPYLRYLF